MSEGRVEFEALTALLERESELLVGRLRLFTGARYAAAALPLPSRADLARHLAQVLAVGGQGLESPGRQLPVVWRQLPELPDLALADQIAVTASDAVRAARALTGRETVPTPGAPTQAREVVAQLCSEVLLHRAELDGAGPGRSAVGTVLAVLAPGNPPDRFAAAARARCWLNA